MVALCNVVIVHAFNMLLVVTGGWGVLAMIALINITLDHLHKVLVLADVVEKIKINDHGRNHGNAAFTVVIQLIL